MNVRSRPNKDARSRQNKDVLFGDKAGRAPFSYIFEPLSFEPLVWPSEVPREEHPAGVEVVGAGARPPRARS